jgi:predicted RNA-binding Zn-ribbon protein involved in translation (DUF1610 family)
MASDPELLRLLEILLSNAEWHTHTCDNCGARWGHVLPDHDLRSPQEYILAHACPQCGQDQRRIDLGSVRRIVV